MPAPKAPYLRFQESYQPNANGCWVWTGSKCQSGYGQIKAFGKMVSAHRLSYELHFGPIPDGLHVLHSCDVKTCVNPDHLRAGTHQQNMREASQRGLMRCGKNHPQHGTAQPRPRQSNTVMVLGLKFPSQKAAERALGLGSGTVRYWIKNKPEKARIIQTGELNA